MKTGFIYLALLSILFISLSGCKSMNDSTGNIVYAVGAENEYADIIAQLGGQYVSVTAIIDSPNLDPHSYQATTKDAITLGKAVLIVQNGLGYDQFMNQLEQGDNSKKKMIIDVAKTLGYPETTVNPHLWYDPNAMLNLAKVITKDLERLLPGETVYFEKNLSTFNASMQNINALLTILKNNYPNAKVAVTEPVADYLLRAAGFDNVTPWGFEQAVMNGTDPSPQDVTILENLLTSKTAQVLVYNQQATDSVTETLLSLAQKNGVPVVGVYETMPAGKTYQSWMTDELTALQQALQNGTSTERIS